ncbi:BMP family lipoprotein [Dactylosporangium sp. CA-233914]|uniref:BMP family lipoprotein n=1 Tax=Dactylosporangium sp. CA-233914 TaxID=3239934 RepID=UPI003D8C6AFD
MKFSSLSPVAATAAVALMLTACSGGTASSPSNTDGKLSIANVVAGPLGDQSMYDSAQRGLDKLKTDGHQTNTLQADANNPTQWKANLESVSVGKWSIVVTGSSQMTDIVTGSAPKFPNQHYIFYDAVVDAPNVASITYKQNEGSFLAGVLAAEATTDKSSFPLSGGSKTVGVIGGVDIPVINDFIAGFKSGVKAVDPSVKVLTSYVGSFSDSAKGYDQAKSMYDQGADVVFQVAGGSGVGALQAAKDANKYAIGVDSNQNAIQKGHVLASMLKEVGNSLVQAIDAAQKGDLAYGKTTSYGLKNNGVALTFDNNGGIVPQPVIDKIDQYKQQVIDGKITVPTAKG